MYEKYPVVLAVAAFIINTKQKILIIKKSEKEQVDPGLWTVPGGKVLPEEPIIDALKREVYEEVGIVISRYDWIGEDVFMSKDRFFHAQHFISFLKTNPQVYLEKKLLEYKWISKDEAHQFAFPPKILKRITMLKLAF